MVLAAVCGPRVGSWGTPKLASVPGDCLLHNLGSRSAGLQPSLLVDHALPLSAGYRGRFGHQRLLPKLEAPPPAWRDTRGNEAEPPPLGQAGEGVGRLTGGPDAGVRVPGTRRRAQRTPRWRGQSGRSGLSHRQLPHQTCVWLWGREPRVRARAVLQRAWSDGSSRSRAAQRQREPAPLIGGGASVSAVEAEAGKHSRPQA